MTTSNNVVTLFPMPRRQAVGGPPISPRKAEANRLRAIYEARKAELGFSQEEAGKAMGINQTMVSQYLTGRKPVGVLALLRFCKFLRVSPLRIRPDFEFAELCPGTLDPEAVDDALAIARLPPALRTPVRNLIHSQGPRPVQ